MDMNFIYALLFTGGLLILSFALVKLRTKKVITSEELHNIKNLFNISTNIVKELKLAKDERITQISEIVLSSLEFACNVYDEADEQKVIDMALKKSFKTCSEFKIPLNDQRKALIEQLVKLGLENIYSKANGKFIKLNQ